MHRSTANYNSSPQRGRRQIKTFKKAVNNGQPCKKARGSNYTKSQEAVQNTNISPLTWLPEDEQDHCCSQFLLEEVHTDRVYTKSLETQGSITFPPGGAPSHSQCVYMHTRKTICSEKSGYRERKLLCTN